jgi:hypothetical protein
MILRHLRANVVAYLALFLALTCTSYAAAQVANGSITTKKLAKNAVTSPKIKAGAVTNADLGASSVKSATVANGSLRAADLAPGTLPEADFLQVNPGGSAPVAVPEGFSLNKQVSVPRAGNLLVRMDLFNVTTACSAGSADMGLYADGTPVPDTKVPGPSASDPYSMAMSALVPVTAGPHTFSIGVDCPSGTINGLTASAGPVWTFALNGD